MNKKLNANYLTSDIEIYNNIQKLKKFVEFITALATEIGEDNYNAKEIIILLEKINQPHTLKTWNVGLYIFDRAIQNRIHKKRGIYMRKWTAFFENDRLEVVAESHHSENPSGHYGNDFQYFASIKCHKDGAFGGVYMTVDFNKFVADVMNYKKYITATLNDIVIDIELDNLQVSEKT